MVYDVNQLKQPPLSQYSINELKQYFMFQWGAKKYPDIALHEWIDHRVLAKQNLVYLPGVIRKVDEGSVIWVEFDYCEGTLVPFTDILNCGKLFSSFHQVSQFRLGIIVC